MGAGTGRGGSGRGRPGGGGMSLVAWRVGRQAAWRPQFFFFLNTRLGSNPTLQQNGCLGYY